MQTTTGREGLINLPDQLEYFDLATSLANGQGLKFFDTRFEQDVYAYRTPGYPAFLSALGPNVRVVRIVQSLIDASTVLATYLLARRWLGQGPSLLAAALVGINPFLMYFSGLLLTETLFTSLLIWAAVGLSVLRDREPDNKAWLCIAAGVVCISLAAIVRPSGLPLALLLPLVMPGAAWRHRIATLVLTIVVLGALFAPWASRNQRLLGKPILATTNGGITLYDGFNPTQLQREGSEVGASDQSFIASMPELREMNEVERSDYLENLGWRFINERPGDAVKLGFAKLARTWSPVPLSAEFGRPVYRAVAVVYAVPLFAMVLMGLWRRALSRAAVVLLLTPAIYFSAVHVMSVGSLRYRVPVEPLLAVIAGAAIVRRTAHSSPGTPGEAG